MNKTTPVLSHTIVNPLIIEGAYKEQIVVELTAADQGCENMLRDNIDFLWTLLGSLVCDGYLKYLMTKQQAIQLIMGCYTRQVDMRDLRQERHLNITEDREMKGYSQTQATAQSSAFTDAIGKSRFDDSSYANSDSTSSRTARSYSYEDTSTVFDDTGFGNSNGDGNTSRSGSNNRTTSSQSNTTGSTTGDGDVQSCAYSFNQTATGGAVLGAGLIGIPLGINGGRTASKTNSDKFQHNSSNSKQIDTRRGSSERHNHGQSQQTDSMNRASSSYFYAVSDGVSEAHGASVSTDDSSSARTSKGHAEGFGAGQNEGRASTTSSSQGSTQGEQIEDHFRVGTINGLKIIDDVKANQRFLHLQKLYDQVTEEIKFYKQDLSAGAGFATSHMNIKYKDCCCVPGQKATLPIQKHIRMYA